MVRKALAITAVLLLAARGAVGLVNDIGLYWDGLNWFLVAFQMLMIAATLWTLLKLTTGRKFVLIQRPAPPPEEIAKESDWLRTDEGDDFIAWERTEI